MRVDGAQKLMHQPQVPSISSSMPMVSAITI